MVQAYSPFWQRVLAAYRRGRLWPALYLRIKPRLTGVKYLLCNPASKRASLRLPKHTAPNSGEIGVVERIFRAFKKMKEDEHKATICYQPSSEWQAQLSAGYSELSRAMAEDDVGRFHFFLANFGASKEYLGVDSILIQHCRDSVSGRRFLQNDLLDKEVRWWQRLYNNRKPIASLSQPQHGNLAGGYIEGAFVGFGSVFDELHGSVLSGLLDDVAHPVVAELGGGFGRLASFILREMGRFTYIDFDLPETLCLAAYYLMLHFPAKRVLLYGEAPYSPSVHRSYDLIFMPSYEISKVGSLSVDLFLNKNSLGEMTKMSADQYITEMCRATRRYLFHTNHDATPNIYSDGQRGPLGYEYPIPQDQFRLLFRYPDLSQVIGLGWFDRSSDTVMYLYQRRTECRTLEGMAR